MCWPITSASTTTRAARRVPSAANFRVFDSVQPILTITGMTISNGNISGQGGGLQEVATGALLQLTDVAFVGNTATANGGALVVSGTSAVATITSCTFT